MVTFNNGEASVYADMMNFGINEAAVSDCLVAGIKFDMSWGDIDLTANPVKLPGGISMGVSQSWTILKQHMENQAIPMIQISIQK